MEKNVTQNKMGVIPINKLMFSMGLPMILSMVVQAFYNIVDSYFVSSIQDGSGIQNLGDYAINALTLSFPIQILIIAIGVGTGVGINALLSRSLGENNRKKASIIAGNGIFLGICTYIVFLIFGIIGVEAFFKTQTSDPLIIQMGIDYLTICSVFSFGAIGFMIFEKLLQSTGRTMASTVAQLAGAVINIILDPILIFGFLGFPAMGVTGAAIATVTGQICSLALGMFFHYRHNLEIDGNFHYLKPVPETIKAIYKIGAPAILMLALMSVMAYGINIISGMISASAVTAFGIYYKIQQFVFFAAIGINNALIPIVAYNYGRQDEKRVKEGIKYGLIYTLILMLIGTVLLQAFAAQICSVFSLSQEVLDLCIQAIRIVSLGFLFAGANIVFQGTFQALGNGMNSLWLSLIRLIIVTLPLAYYFSLLSNASNLVWLCFPIAEGCGFLIGLFILRHELVNKISKLSAPKVADSFKEVLN
ncbi:MATE family efflux transporter [Eubacteriaceae bacterium ES3]|nr:MATE family efflux transporter [Eubacteriaceae bacterium ES3]